MPGEAAMNLSVNGHSQVPPGFRFHPTEEELLHYYLRKKVASEKIDLDVIRDVDLNKLEPWDIQGAYILLSFLCFLENANFIMTRKRGTSHAQVQARNFFPKHTLIRCVPY